MFPIPTLMNNRLVVISYVYIYAYCMTIVSTKFALISFLFYFVQLFAENLSIQCNSASHSPARFALADFTFHHSLYDFKVPLPPDISAAVG